MPPTQKDKSYLLGGIILCAFPACVLLVLHLEQRHLPMPFPILFGLFFLHGIRAVIWSVFQWDFDNTASWIINAIGAAGFAIMAFWVAWYEKQGWSGGLPFIPTNWNQHLARFLFAGGGLLGALFALRCLRKALHRYKGKPDHGIKQT